LQATTPAQIAATADALRKSAHESQTRAHQLQRKQEALELALKPLAAERERTASQRAQVVSVTVTLACPERLRQRPPQRVKKSKSPPMSTA
jgi:hypothetical protein